MCKMLKKLSEQLNCMNAPVGTIEDVMGYQNHAPSSLLAKPIAPDSTPLQMCVSSIRGVQLFKYMSKSSYPHVILRSFMLYVIFFLASFVLYCLKCMLQE